MVNSDCRGKSRISGSDASVGAGSTVIQYRIFSNTNAEPPAPSRFFLLLSEKTKRRKKDSVFDSISIRETFLTEALYVVFT